MRFESRRVFGPSVARPARLFALEPIPKWIRFGDEDRLHPHRAGAGPYRPDCSVRPRRALDTDRQLVAPEIAFLRKFGVNRDTLLIATRQANREGVCAARALMAYGGVSECYFYLALARHLGISLDAAWPHLAMPIDIEAIQAKGLARLDGCRRWIVAPTGDALRLLLDAHEKSLIDPSSMSLTTPGHLDAILRHRSRTTIVEAASLHLPRASPQLSAKDVCDLPTKVIVVLFAALAAVAMCMAPVAACNAIGPIFFAAMTFRLVVCAGACCESTATPVTVTDEDAPFYTVLVPLYHEAHMVDGLIAALDKLDYPRSKLEILLLVETEDEATRAVLSKTNLPPRFSVVAVPDGFPRTKPRALNAGLFVARGSLITIYDAEDRPDPDQLRRAAARFATAPADLACLQAGLTIDNGAASWLARLFAIEYAGLFQLFNVGVARLVLPMALGGTSNHFRASAVRAIGAWDAWNVTEDADLGLRLARFGFRTDVLASSTKEQALHRPSRWFKQRRRWTKGWLQTTLVLMRGGRKTVGDLGAWRTVMVGLMLINLVIGPLVAPFFFGFVIGHLTLYGLPTPQGPIALIETTLSYSVIVMGIGSTLWCGFEGLRRSGQTAFISSLPLLLPYQLMISLAAWGGLIDLFRDPYHWHKTEHTREPDGS